jgi:hypothetical protein
MKFIKLYICVKFKNDWGNKYLYKNNKLLSINIKLLGALGLFIWRDDMYIFLSCSCIDILDLSWREIRWRFLLCVRRRRGIEFKCCLDDDHCVASLGYICDVGSQIQQFKYVSILITWKTLCVERGFWMTCTVYVLKKHSASSVNDYRAQSYSNVQSYAGNINHQYTMWKRTAGESTDDNIRVLRRISFACCVTTAKDTIRICKTYCSSKARDGLTNVPQYHLYMYIACLVY